LSGRFAVYRTFTAERELLYAGISKEFGRRWGEHARSQPWWPEARHMTVDWYDDEAEAMRAEVTAIEQERPRHNVARANANYRAERNTDHPKAQHYMGTAEIGQGLNVSRQRVQQITRGQDFPAPYAVLAAGKLWKREDVEVWAKAHGRELAC
jgi:prophage regulatory protein